MVLRVVVGNSVMNIVSVYTPQVGRSTEEKKEFYGVLRKLLRETSTNECLYVCLATRMDTWAKSQTDIKVTMVVMVWAAEI
jgi:CRISPR/Cas system CSM-associated protein Csm2 small subunit